MHPNDAPPPPPAPQATADYGRPPVRRPAPPGAAPRRSGCLKATIFLLIFCGSMAVVAAVGMLILAAGSSDFKPNTVTDRISELQITAQPGVKDKIAIISIKGVIMNDGTFDGVHVARVGAELRKAAQDDSVVAVVLDLDTPGGEVTASDEIHRAVVRFRDCGKPVVACMRSVCASGGYYVAVAADHIVANRVSLTGSIGVIFPGFRYRELLDKIGVEASSYTSGEMKNMLSGSADRSPAEQEFLDQYMTSLVRKTFHRFATVVAEGRPGYETAEAVMEAPFGDGRVLTGEDALDYGLVDQLGYLEDAIGKAMAMAGVVNANVVRYAPGFSLRALLFSSLEERSLDVKINMPGATPGVHSRGLYYLMPELAP